MKRFVMFLLKLLLLLLIACGIFFFWASSPTLSEKEYATIRINQYEDTTGADSIYSIVTYNIGYLSGMTNNRSVAKPKELFEKNLQKVITEINAIAPDIIAFQEIDYNASRSYQVHQQNEIATLGYNFVAEAVNWDETYMPFPYWPPSMHFGKVVSGQSVLSKYPIKSQERIVLARVENAPFYRDALYLERLAQVVKVRIENKDVVLINVHLEAFDKPTRVKQFKEVMALFNSCKDEYPTILLGDFNAKARGTDAVIQPLFLMPNVGNAAFNSENPVNTFDSRNPKKRIDYIFYTSNSIDYIGGKVLTQFGEASDHLPVEMRFKLK